MHESLVGPFVRAGPCGTLLAMESQRSTIKDTGRSESRFSWFVAGMLMSAVLATFAIPFILGKTRTEIPSAEQSVVEIQLDYDRLESILDRLEQLSATRVSNSSASAQDGPWTRYAEARQAHENGSSDWRSRAEPIGDEGADGSFTAIPVSDRTTPATSSEWPATRIEPRPSLRTGRHVAENGSWYGQPNAYGVPKTVFVNGYYRRDGTYVRGHYRSAPGSSR